MQDGAIGEHTLEIEDRSLPPDCVSARPVGTLVVSISASPLCVNSTGSPAFYS